MTEPTAPARVLSVTDLEKSYGSLRAVKGISLELFEGEILAVVGENGAGKSTLMKMIAGVERPDSGEIAVGGVSGTFATPADARRAGVRMMPQEISLCPEMSIAENIMLGTMPTSGGLLCRPSDTRRAARDRLALLGLEHLDVRDEAGRLAVDERAFVQLAAALDEGTRVLIVDEPTAPMSAAEVSRVLGVMRMLTTRGIAILYISHRLDEVIQLCSRAVVLRDGDLVANLDQAVMTPAALVEAMIGRAATAVRETPDVANDAPVALKVSHLRGGNLTDVSLEVRRGEIVGIYGVLGSGRENLGAALIGAIPRTADQLEVNERDLRGRGIRALLRAGAGYVPAERRSQGLLLESSVADNLGLGHYQLMARRGLLTRRATRRAAAAWIEALDIAAQNPDVLVGTLSGGSQQKVLLARSLAAGATVHILEEPTRGVDVGSKMEIYDILRRRAAQGDALLIVSSDLEELDLVCDRVVIIRHGQSIANLTSFDQQTISGVAMGLTSIGAA